MASDIANHTIHHLFARTPLHDAVRCAKWYVWLLIETRKHEPRVPMEVDLGAGPLYHLDLHSDTKGNPDLMSIQLGGKLSL